MPRVNGVANCDRKHADFGALSFYQKHENLEDFNVTKRITALFLTLVTLLSLVAVPANAASTLEEAMAEVNVYARNDDLDWLRVNGAVKTQHYTFYEYQSELTGQTTEIPAYCTDPRLYDVPALVPEGTASPRR